MIKKILLNVFWLSLFLSIQSLTFAEITQDLQQAIDHVGSIVSSTPQAVFKEIEDIRNKYQKQLTIENKVSLIAIEAWAYLYSNNLQMALKTTEKMRALSSSGADIVNWTLHNTKGNIFWHMGLGQQALKEYLQAYELIKHNNLNIKERMVTENNIGYISIKLGFYKEALPYLERALEYYLTSDSDELLGIAYNNLGEALFYLQQVDKAFSYHRKALTIRLNKKLDFHASYSYHNLGLVYFSRKNYLEAKKSLKKAINIRKKNNYALGVLESELILAKVYLATKENKAFIALLSEIIEKAKKESLVILADAYQLQSEFYKTQGNYKKALRAYENFYKSLEKVQLKKTDSHLAQYITQSSTIEKELNILKLQKINEIQKSKAQAQQKMLFIIFTAAIIIVTILSLFLWLLKLKQRKIQQINQSLSQALIKLKTTQDKLIESEKMSALTTLVSGMAHQMNTPLGVGITAISMIEENMDKFSSALQEGKLKRSAMKNIIDDVTQASQLALSNMNKTAKLVTQFKMVSTELESDAKEQFELLELLRNQAALVIAPIEDMSQLNNDYHLARKNAQVKPTITIHGNKVNLLGYPSAIAKVLMHLINNSIEHAFSHTPYPQINIEVKTLAKTVQIHYQDNGIGIDSKKITKIFDPFFTSKMGGENIGLGLSIAYNLVVHLMQGSIIVEPSKGKGASFIICFPLQIK